MIGPIVGGYLSESLGWRWTFWLICILVSPFVDSLDFMVVSVAE